MKTVDGLISVIMTNYNTPENCLREAIDSILNQTYSNFEFIIVDDCSTDESLQIIRSYSDSRIVILQNKENMGLTKSLNKALSIAQGEFIARMDSDDICDSHRFEKQVEYLKQHQDVIVCGTWAKMFGTWKEERYSNETICRSIPQREVFRVMLLFGNYPNIVHSCAMFNHNILLKYGIKYNENYIYAQDYRMWVECSKYAECAIIKEFLFYIRIRGGSISTGKRTIQDDCAFRIMQEQLNALDLKLTDDVKKYHVNLLSTRQKYDDKCLKWIKTIIQANRKKNVYKQHILEDILWKKWAEIVYFGLKGCSLIEKVRRINTLPFNYYPVLCNIWMERKRKRGN